MKIHSTKVGFTNRINIGKFAFKIYFDEDGTELEHKDLADQASHFNRVVLVLDNYDPLTERSELLKFVNRIRDKNEDSIIEINTFGIYKPASLLSKKNIQWNVFVQIQKDGRKFTERINHEVLNELKHADANFIFKINSQDDLDITNSIINDLEIPKRQVYLLADGMSFDEMNTKAKFLKYNITAEVGGL